MSDITEAQIKLGLQAEAFEQSDIGRLILGQAEQDIQEAKDKLLGIDPYKFSTLSDLQNAISSLQSDAKTAQRIKDYIDETIINGHQADQPEED